MTFLGYRLDRQLRLWLMFISAFLIWAVYWKPTDWVYDNLFWIFDIGKFIAIVMWWSWFNHWKYDK